MTNYKYFIGVDIGKTTNAICVIDTAENRQLECSIPNTKAGMQTLLDKLNRLPGFTLSETLFCMEHTGIYCRPIVGFFYPLGADLWLQSAVHIKHSLGLKRGKTDKADARLIARYSIRHQADKRLFMLTDNDLGILRQLAQQRDRLMEMAKTFTDLSQDYQDNGPDHRTQTSPANQRGSSDRFAQANCVGRKANRRLYQGFPGAKDEHGLADEHPRSGSANGLVYAHLHG